MRRFGCGSKRRGSRRALRASADEDWAVLDVDTRRQQRQGVEEQRLDRAVRISPDKRGDSVRRTEVDAECHLVRHDPTHRLSPLYREPPTGSRPAKARMSMC
ncbi:hypothetical protein GCM10010532_114060 [Dactylosporangium siamense]|uniref:Uncharacterized protein n=1 Tax=Dactylosporangium siamense TaxID=685454 RepID=A0A919PYW7_9ACTN|nr:hypothetical protein Dsi01nite_109980 [Dactylosporangium siamense]